MKKLIEIDPDTVFFVMPWIAVILIVIFGFIAMMSEQEQKFELEKTRIELQIQELKNERDWAKYNESTQE